MSVGRPAPASPRWVRPECRYSCRSQPAPGTPPTAVWASSGAQARPVGRPRVGSVSLRHITVWRRAGTGPWSFTPGRGGGPVLVQARRGALIQDRSAHSHPERRTAPRRTAAVGRHHPHRLHPPALDTPPPSPGTVRNLPPPLPHLAPRRHPHTHLQRSPARTRPLLAAAADRLPALPQRLDDWQPRTQMRHTLVPARGDGVRHTVTRRPVQRTAKPAAAGRVPAWVRQATRQREPAWCPCQRWLQPVAVQGRSGREEPASSCSVTHHHS